MRAIIKFIGIYRATLIGTLVLIALELVIWLQKSISLSDKIQAGSVIALVFITLFYAVQTQRLVQEERKSLEEEKNKREADFGVRRIEEFLQPIDDYLVDFTDDLLGIKKDLKLPLINKWESRLDRARGILDKLEKYFNKNYIMSNNLLNDRWREFRDKTTELWPTIENQEKDYVLQWINQTLHGANLIRLIFIGEMLEISKHIQKTYGFYLEDFKERKEALDKINENAKDPLI